MIGVCKNNNTADDNFIWDYLLSIIYEKRRKGIKEEGQKKESRSVILQPVKNKGCVC